MKNLSLVAAMLALGGSYAAADEIQLANGQKIPNAIRRTDSKMPGKVIIEVGAGTIVLDEKQVSSVNPGRTPLHEYEDKWNAVKSSSRASDFWDLAKWCQANKVTRHLGTVCGKVIALEPDHEGAHKMLGHEKVGGKWMTYEQAQEARGLKLVEDRWMTKAEVQLMEKRRLEAKEREMAAKAERDAEKEERRRLRQQMLDDQAAWLNRQLSQLDGYFVQPDWCWPAFTYFRPYPWAAYQRSRNYYQYGWMYGGGGVTPTLDIFRFIPDASLRR